MKPRAGWLRQLLIVILVGIVLFFPTLGRWYTEWLWFGEVGYRVAFWTPIVSRTLVGLAAGLAVFLILFPNVRPLLRLRGVPKVIDLRSQGGRTYRQITSRLRPPAMTAVVVGVVSALAGRGAAESWMTFQAWFQGWFHQVP